MDSIRIILGDEGRKVNCRLESEHGPCHGKVLNGTRRWARNQQIFTFLSPILHVQLHLLHNMKFEHF